jgi:hypothetical protein
VARIWHRFGVQPWRTQSFTFSTDPGLEAKIDDVVGLYLHPPAKAVVLCVDERPQIQALEGPPRPLGRPAWAGTVARTVRSSGHCSRTVTPPENAESCSSIAVGTIPGGTSKTTRLFRLFPGLTSS